MRPNIRRGQPQLIQETAIPAPIGGINATSSMVTMAPTECIFCENILAEDFGCEVRDGFVEWANGWTGGIARTVITFEGNVDTDDRLWVANDLGIWDVTAEGETNPTQVVTFPSNVGNAGICSFINFGNDAGDRFVLLCDGENGYYVWTQTTDIWLKIAEGVGGIIGVDPALFDFVVIWKTRVWFIQRDSGLAWFIDTSEQFLGTVVPFNWADQFKSGGKLTAIYNWTLDGGKGIDEYIVGLSGAGDVIIYQGTDPTSKNDFSLVGSWFVGEPPLGRRTAVEYSGDLFMLTVQGLIPLSALLRGQTQSDDRTYISNKVGPYIRRLLDELLDDFGWHLTIHPKQSVLYVNSPPAPNRPQVAFSIYFGTKAWSIISGLPKADTGNWKAESYWTDVERNKIFIQKGFSDHVYLDPIADGPPQPVEWELLTAFSPLGTPSKQKRVQYIRPQFVSDVTPNYFIRARYDYDISRIFPSPADLQAASQNWDFAKWDLSLWGGALSGVSDRVTGGDGMGRAVALALKGRSQGNVTLIGFDIAYDSGGFL